MAKVSTSNVYGRSKYLKVLFLNKSNKYFPKYNFIIHVHMLEKQYKTTLIRLDTRDGDTHVEVLK